MKMVIPDLADLTDLLSVTLSMRKFLGNLPEIGPARSILRWSFVGASFRTSGTIDAPRNHRGNDRRNDGGAS